MNWCRQYADQGDHGATHRGGACRVPAAVESEEHPVSTVRTVVQPGWLAVSGPEVDAVIEAADRQAESLEAAAAGGLPALLEALTAHGLSSAPGFAACAPTSTGVRVVVRGRSVVVLPDGTRVDARGRMPWLDFDLDVAVDDEGEVVLVAPEPPAPRGWQRPARLSRTPTDQLVSAGTPEVGAGRTPSDQLVDAGTPEVGAGGTPSDLLVDAGTGGAERDDSDPVVEVESPVADAEPVADAVPAPAQPDLILPPPPDATGLPPARVAATPAPRSGVVDAVPWRRADRTPPPPTGASTPPESTPPASPPPPTTELLPAVDLEAPTHAVSEPGARQAPEQPAPPTTGGDTLEVPAPAAEHPTTPDVTTHPDALPRSDDELDRPVVLAVLCPAGHPSPPHAGSCRTCGREIPPQQAFPTPRPSLGVLRISTGGSVPLDRGVVLGRAPRVNEDLPANQRPHLLRVGGVDRDISRNHAEIVLEGWHVLVRDLGSTNGTTVTLPGQEPVRLRPTEDQGIEPGTVITLAGEVELTYEVDA